MRCRAEAVPASDGEPEGASSRDEAERQSALGARSRRWRLRELPPGALLVALALVAIMLVPFVVSFARAHDAGWEAGADDALLGLRSYDVVGSDPPLVGQPSTSYSDGRGIATAHPGPIELWLFAPLVRAVGGHGMLWGALFVNAASVLLTVWVAFRRGGPAVALGAVVVLSLVLRSTGTAFLGSPVSSNMWGLPILATAACCWALACGDHRLLPVTAFWASFAAQQHLAAVFPTLCLVAWGVGALLVGTWRRQREGTDPSVQLATVGRWLCGAAGVGLVVWLPPLVQQFTGDPGNITALLRYAGDGSRSPQGWGPAAAAAINAFGPVPVVFRTEITGDLLRGTPSIAAVLGAAVVGALAVGVLAWRRADPRARAAVATGLVVVPVGLFNAASIPDSFEVSRINLYRWVWPASVMVVGGIVWAVLEAAAVRRQVHTRVSPAAATWAAVATAMLVVLSIMVFLGPDDRVVDADAFPVDRRVARSIARDAGDARDLLLVPTGNASALSIVPAVALELELEGYDIEVPAGLAPFYGPQRRTDWRVDAAYVVSSEPSRARVPEGRVVDEMLVDQRLRPTLAALAPAIAVGNPILVKAGQQRMAKLSRARRFDVGLNMKRMKADPSVGLLDPVIVGLLRTGGIAGVSLDPATLDRHARVLATSRTVWADRRVVVVRAGSDDVRAMLDRTGPPPE